MKNADINAKFKRNFGAKYERNIKIDDVEWFVDCFFAEISLVGGRTRRIRAGGRGRCVSLPQYIPKSFV